MRASFILLMLTIGSHGAIADDKAPALEVKIDDNFIEDSRSAYQMRGESDWSEGELDLRQDSTISTKFKTGSHVVVDLSIELPKLGAESDDQLLFQFDLDSSSAVTIVAIRQKVADSIETEVRFYDLEAKGNETDSKLVRVLRHQGDLPSGNYSITYRYGLIQMQCEDLSFFAYAEHSSAYVTQVKIGGPMTLRHVKVLGVEQPKLSMQGELTYNESVQKANELAHQVRDLYLQQKFRGALDPAREAVGIHEQITGGFHPGYFNSLYLLGMLHLQLHQLDSAQELIKKACDASRIHFGEMHPTYAGYLDALGGLYYQSAKTQAAEECWNTALHIREPIIDKSHPIYAQTLNNLAALYVGQGRFLVAEPKLRLSVQIARETEEKRQLIRSLTNLAVVYRSMARYDDARTSIEEVLECARSEFGEESGYFASAIMEMAVLNMIMGDLVTAESQLKTASRIFQNLDNSGDQLAMCFHFQSQMHSRMGDFQQAVNYAGKAYESFRSIRGDHYPETIRILFELANALCRVGDYNEAKKYCEQVRAQYAAHSDGNNAYHAQAVELLANIQTQTHDYEQADANFTSATKILTNITNTDSPHFATLLSNHSNLLRLMGEHERAKELIERSLRIQENAYGKQHLSYLITLKNFATLCFSLKQWQQASASMDDAIAGAESLIERHTLIQSERQQLANAESLRDFLDDFIAINAVTQRNVTAAYKHVLAWKGRTLLRQRAYRQLAENPKTRELFQQLRNTSSQLIEFRNSPSIKKDEDEWKTQIGQMTEKKEELESELAKISSEIGQTERHLKVDELVASLPKSVALIDFLQCELKYFDDSEVGAARTEKRYLAFVVRNGQEIQFFDLADSEEVADAVTRWRQGFGQQDSDEAGQFLRQAIWNPLEAHLEGITQVLVSPDGALARLPFNALPGRKAGSYLIEEYQIACVPVPQMLGMSPSESDDPTRRMLLLGGIDYGGTANATSDSGLSRFDSLSGSSAEIDEIHQIFSRAVGENLANVVTLQGQQATEAIFREKVSNCTIVHFATHGFSIGDDGDQIASLDGGFRSLATAMTGPTKSFSDPVLFHAGIQSGLALSGANLSNESDHDDGILTSQEIAFLPMSQVDMAVLSACETGLGRATSGEGLLGLQRAFQVAGTKSTIASLWKVHDSATSDLMTRFYDNLLRQKMPKIEALRQAQLSILNDSKIADLRFRGPGNTNVPMNPTNQNGKTHPMFWAAWVISGDPQSMSAITTIGPTVTLNDSDAQNLNPAWLALLVVAGALGVGAWRLRKRRVDTSSG